MKNLIANFNATTEDLNGISKFFVILVLVLIVTGCLTLAYNLMIGNVPNQFLY